MPWQAPMHSPPTILVSDRHDTTPRAGPRCGVRGCLWVLQILGVVFFFSSRRRHTRCLSDWSSDVCSSDLSYVENRPDADPFALPKVELLGIPQLVNPSEVRDESLLPS